MTTSISKYDGYLCCVGDLLKTEQVKRMRELPHHPGVTCFEHCLFVSYWMYRLGHLLHLDFITCGRVGLLHDLYLYRWNDESAHPGNQIVDHPEFACRHAKEVTPLTPRQENMILCHMWPLSKYLPESREAWLLTVVDKVCCTLETLQIWKHMKTRRDLLKACDAIIS